MSDKATTRYRVWNDTDGMPASTELFNNSAEACAFINQFRRRTFTPNGYKTADGKYIDPMQIEMHIEEVELTQEELDELDADDSWCIFDSYSQGISTDELAGTLNGHACTMTKLEWDKPIRLFITDEQTGNHVTALADTLTIAEEGNAVIAGFVDNDEAIAQECMEKLFEMVQFKTKLDIDGDYAEMYLTSGSPNWKDLKAWIVRYIKKARVWSKSGCDTLKGECVAHANGGEPCSQQCSYKRTGDDEPVSPSLSGQHE